MTMWTRKQRFLGQAAVLLAFGLSSGCTTVQRMNVPGLAAITRSGTKIAAQASPAPASPAPAVQPPALPPNTTQPPAVAGSRLPSIESETATQKAIELARRLNEAVAEKKRLATRVDELEASDKTKDQALEQARVEIQSARSELARARQELAQWKLEIAALRDQLRGADEENLQTLQTAVSLLQQVLTQTEDQGPTSTARANSADD
jgi:DNA repair exonuclease SbcCD ATPase subunit